MYDNLFRKPEEKKEFEPEEKEAANAEQAKIETPKTEQVFKSLPLSFLFL